MRPRIEPNVDVTALNFSDLAEPPGFSESERVFKRLWWLIVSLQLPPGEPITEEFLAAVLDTSRTPVRDAVQRLGNAGMITRPTARSLQVSSLTVAEMLELSELRERLEGYLAHNVALRVRDGLVTLDRLAAINKALTTLSRGAALVPTLVAGMDFHDHMLDMSDAPHLRRMLRNTYFAFRRYQFAIQSEYQRFTVVAREHARLIAALRAHDAELAEQLARAHVAAARPSQTKALRKVLKTRAP